jgi:hypothetical protein
MTSLSQRPSDPFPSTLAEVLRRPALWPVLVHAVGELALARWRLGRRHVRDLIGAVPPHAAIPNTPTPQADRIAARVAWAVPRMAARVPWRADCLVQATAAQRWLHREHIPTQLHIGVRKDRPAGFEAHAWLCHGALIVTGGDVSGFVPLTPRDV